MRIIIRYDNDSYTDFLGLEDLAEAIKAAALFATEMGVGLESIEIVPS